MAGLSVVSCWRSKDLVIEEAPAPRLAGFDATHDGVASVSMVGSPVVVPGAVTAADVTAGHADPQLDPQRADVQAVLAPWGARHDGPDGVEVSA
jgi:hypothetical protein